MEICSGSRTKVQQCNILKNEEWVGERVKAKYNKLRVQVNTRSPLKH